MTELESFGDNF